MIYLQGLFAAGFFAALLLSGAYVFGASFGSPTRGAVVPLLVIPLATDWFRLLLKFSPATALAVSLALYLVFTAGIWLWTRPKGPLAGMDAAARRNWWFCLGILLAIHFLLRIWLFTGSVPNPADDQWAGFKTNGLIHSSSWPTMTAGQPEIAMSYYYYGWEWGAAFACWLGIAPIASWWAVAIVLCVAGEMLLLELILPRLRSRRDLILASMVIFNGCGISFLMGICLGLAPKDWREISDIVSSRYGLYLFVPSSDYYWTPTAVLAMGLLMVALFVFWRMLEKRKVDWAVSVFVVLGLASLAGYCTFDLLGLVLVIAPVMLVAALAVDRRETVRQWLPHVTGVAIVSMLLCLPLVLTFIHRAGGGVRAGRFQGSLPVWLQTAPNRFGIPVVVGMALWALLCTAARNLLIFPVLFHGDRRPQPVLTRILAAIFLLGSCACFLGVIDNFSKKFGGFVALAAIMAYFTMENPPKWSFPLLVCGIFGPTLLALNTVRANLFLEKVDPVWRALDRITDQTHEVVLYSFPLPEREHDRWLPLEPYDSRAQFLEPADEINSDYQIYVANPRQFEALPPTPVRLRKLMGGNSTYLLLRAGDPEPAGKRLYSSKSFTLDRVQADAIGAEANWMQPTSPPGPVAQGHSASSSR